jgi:methylmalonyl-CoA mutase C-terminal domain/subunit
MAERKIRILLGRLGDAGFEVIYTELQDPDAIVSSAMQESVDHIGITTLPGVDIGAFEEIKRILKEEAADHITITAGGFLEEEDIPKIKAMGVMEFFPKGTSLREMTAWAKKNIKS